jgi:hypothetical protein
MARSARNGPWMPVALSSRAAAPGAGASQIDRVQAARARRLARVATFATVFLLVGGLRSFGASRIFEGDDPAADRWQRLADLPRRLQHFTMAGLGGRLPDWRLHRSGLFGRQRRDLGL